MDELVVFCEFCLEQRKKIRHETVKISIVFGNKFKSMYDDVWTNWD